MNLKLFYLLFDSSLMVQQTDPYRGSSAMLQFQSSSGFSVQVYLFSLRLRFNIDTSGRKL